MKKDGVSVDPTKVEAVTKWECPTTITSVRSFLGLADTIDGLCRTPLG